MGNRTGSNSAPDKGPDNNKRLAELEKGVSALALTLMSYGIALAAGDDPISLAIGALEAQSEAIKLPASMLATALAAAGVTLAADADPVLVAVDTIASKGVIQAEHDRLVEFLLANHNDAIEGSAVDTAIKLLEAVKAGPDGASEGEIAAIARAEKAELELKGALEDLDIANSDKNRLALEAAALRDAIEEKPGFLDKIRGALGRKDPGAGEGEGGEASAPLVRERPEHARDLGPTYGKLDNKDLAELLAGGTELEIAFSNGVHEIVDLAPVKIGSSDLASLGGRRIVNVPILIRGGGHREELHGAALIHDGEQVHYCQFPGLITIEPGQERQFVKAIFFG